ncbi:hypothetical protein [Bordetella sp. LUAb4]|uniref:hypothetical protein n=1 Tax=Bordetella sp. LUAb4 TaxID=2843195 RepID=UPI001E286E6D|nr:hypothetical protein [Bordetella sp. LUAb4]
MTGDIEDGPSKERRNLVALATIVIVVAFLKVPQPGAILFGTIELKDVPTHRLWIAVGAALLYLVLHYLTAPTIRTSAVNWLNEFRQARTQAVDSLSLPHLERALRGELTKFQLIRSDGSSVQKMDFDSVFVQEESRADSGWGRVYAVQWIEQWKDRNQKVAFSGNGRRSDVSVIPPFSRRAKVLLLSLWRTRGLDWAMLEFVFPISWAAIAAVICVNGIPELIQLLPASALQI